MSEYDDFDRALLRAGKKASAPTSRMRARALGAAAGAGAATAAATTKAAAATKVGALAKATKTILAMKLTMVAAVTTASVGTAVYVVETHSEKTEPAAIVVAAPASAPASAATAKTATPIPAPEPAPAETIDEPTTVAEPAPLPKPIVVAKPAPIVVPAKSTIDPLREELGLVEDARRAFAAGDSTTALRQIDDHARRFPAGAFAVERDVLRIDALVAAGRRDEAAARARDFLSHHPGSAQARRIAKITETNP